jgi:hypothetical protein
MLSLGLARMTDVDDNSHRLSLSPIVAPHITSACSRFENVALNSHVELLSKLQL